MKCPYCKSMYERKVGFEINACPLCLRLYYREYVDESFEERNDKFESNKEYKDKLQGITHRGKVKV